jgi:hypothetical protein
MVVGHISKIEYEVWADVGSGSTLYYRGVVPFGTGSIPLAPSIETSFDSVGNLNITVTGDSDTMSIRLGASLSSAAAALANMAAATPVAGRVVQYVNVLLAVASGATVFVACAAYPTVGGTGTVSDTTQVVIARQGPGGMTPSGVITKTLRVHGVQFVAAPAFDFQYSHDGIEASLTLLGARAALAYIPLPMGITITGISAKLWDTGSPSAFGVYLVKVLGVSSNSNVGTLNASAVGGEQTVSTTFSEGPIGTSAAYILEGIWPTRSSGAQNWNIEWVDITYTMPSYDKTI